MKLNILYKTLIFSAFVIILSCDKEKPIDIDFVIYSVNPKTENVAFFWKDSQNKPLRSIKNLKKFVDSKHLDLKFAMNGGMFVENNIPKGLYIENFKTLNPIDTSMGKGNFYLKPNGIFYITKSNEYKIVRTENFEPESNIKFATQSGPMLLVNGTINPVFQRNSNNLNIRNGVGILKNGNPVFVMSKKEINFYSFVLLFKNMGCKNTLYLDGFVSRAYFPQENWVQEDGDFGVMIGVTAEK